MSYKENKFIRIISTYNRCIFSGLSGGIILFITFKMSDDIYKIFLQTISSYLIVSCILEILNKYFHEDNLIKDICDGINSEIGSMKLGIIKIDIEGERKLSSEKIIIPAQKRIDIIHLYGYSWTSTNDKFLIEALKNSKLKVRVVIADYNNSILLNYYNNHYNKDVSVDIQKTISLWKDIYAQAGKKENLEIYLYDGIVTHALHLNENSIIIKSISTCKSKYAANTTTIYAKKVEHGIYEKYECEFEQIIKESKRCNFIN